MMPSHRRLFHHCSPLPRGDHPLPSPSPCRPQSPQKASCAPTHPSAPGRRCRVSPGASAATERSIPAPASWCTSPGGLPRYFWGHFGVNPWTQTVLPRQFLKEAMRKWIRNTPTRKTWAVFCSIEVRCWILHNEAGMGLLKSRKRSLLQIHASIYVYVCLSVSVYIYIGACIYMSVSVLCFSFARACGGVLWACLGLGFFAFTWSDLRSNCCLLRKSRTRVGLLAPLVHLGPHPPSAKQPLRCGFGSGRRGRWALQIVGKSAAATG